MRERLRKELILSGLGYKLLLLEVAACLAPRVHLILGVVVRLKSIDLGVSEANRDDQTNQFRDSHNSVCRLQISLHE